MREDLARVSSRLREGKEEDVENCCASIGHAEQFHLSRRPCASTMARNRYFCEIGRIFVTVFQISSFPNLPAIGWKRNRSQIVLLDRCFTVNLSRVPLLLPMS